MQSADSCPSFQPEQEDVFHVHYDHLGGVCRSQWCCLGHNGLNRYENHEAAGIGLVLLVSASPFLSQKTKQRQMLQIN